jgi:spermidine/putrescine transport system permease protein
MMKTFKGVFIGLVFLYLYIPLGLLMANAFNQSRFGHHWKGFTLKWYARLVDNEMLLEAFQHSLTIGLLAATAATVIGTLMAIALYRYRFKGKKLAGGLVFMLLVSPDIVLAISLLVVFVLLGIQLGFWSLLLAHITFCLPFVVVTVYTALKGFDEHLLAAARDLGAGEGQAMIRILLPLLSPALVAGWLLSFTVSLDDVIVSSFITGPGYEILPVRVYSMVRVGVSPEINALATLLLVISLILVGLSQWLVRRNKQ